MLKYSDARKRIYLYSVTKIGSFIMPVKYSVFMLTPKQEQWKHFLRKWALLESKTGCEQIGVNPGFRRDVGGICALLGYYTT